MYCKNLNEKKLKGLGDVSIAKSTHLETTKDLCLNPQHLHKKQGTSMRA